MHATPSYEIPLAHTVLWASLPEDVRAQARSYLWIRLGRYLMRDWADYIRCAGPTWFSDLPRESRENLRMLLYPVENTVLLTDREVQVLYEHTCHPDA